MSRFLLLYGIRALCTAFRGNEWIGIDGMACDEVETGIHDYVVCFILFTPCYLTMQKLRIELADRIWTVFWTKDHVL